jgi:hypothetical protein
MSREARFYLFQIKRWREAGFSDCALTGKQATVDAASRALRPCEPVYTVLLRKLSVVALVAGSFLSVGDARARKPRIEVT